MAVHELATNAGKYGALKRKGGRIAIEWSVLRNDPDEVRFTWKEHARVEPGARRGFGTQVIEKIVPHMLGGTSRLTLDADGALC